MANTQKIRNRIKSVRDTRKITNAMYLISSAKLRRAKKELESTRPFFSALVGEMKHILDGAGRMKSRYFENSGGECCLVITADRGLAGAYNHNVLRAASGYIKDNPGITICAAGEYGRGFFTRRGIAFDESFNFHTQDPTLERAREISRELLGRYMNGDAGSLSVIYTDHVNGLVDRVVKVRLLPLDRDNGTSESESETEYFPSAEKVLGQMISGYVTGFIYGALVDSFCAEQSERMIAMEAAGRNADKLLRELTLQFNRARQADITREITEVSAGAAARAREDGGA